MCIIRAKPYRGQKRLNMAQGEGRFTSVQGDNTHRYAMRCCV